MPRLTPRLLEVAELVADGCTDKQIAARLGIGYNTARIHVAAIAFRLQIPGGANTRVLIARWWWRHHPDFPETHKVTTAESA